MRKGEWRRQRGCRPPPSPSPPRRRGGPPFEGSRSVSTVARGRRKRLFREDGYGMMGELGDRKIHDGRLFRRREGRAGVGELKILMPMQC